MEELSKTGRPDRFFAASNSAHGFKNYFDEIFSPREYGKVYILKGGPGTGKSRFMRDVAQAAEEKGYKTEYFYCSSDPDSLDGLIIGEGMCAIIDGTAPHATDPIYPGCVDTIINLGEHWNEEMLTDSRERIIELSDAKKRAYSMAYRFLEASELVADEIRREARDAVELGKLRGAVSRMFAKVPAGARFEKTTRIVNSVGMNGEVGFDTFINKAKTNYYILDVAGTAYIFFSELYKKANEKKLPVYVSYSPISPDIIDALYFPSLSISFTSQKKKLELKENEKLINMARFINRERLSEIRGKIRFCARCRDALLSEAIDRLGKAKEAHFALEEIYIAAMDFESKEKATAKWINKIIGYCEKRKNMVE